MLCVLHRIYPRLDKRYSASILTLNRIGCYLDGGIGGHGFLPQLPWRDASRLLR